MIIAQDEQAFIKKAAQFILETSAEAVQERKRATWSLAGGNTPKKVYSLLSDPYYRERISWRDVSIFWGDERCVPPDHLENNYKMAMDTFLSKVPVPPANIHRIPSEMASPQEAGKAYENELRLFFKLDRPFPKFDLMLLGLGEDGHVASLFPGSSALKETQKWVVGNWIEKLKQNRITLTFPVINDARRVLFLCFGETKAAIVKEILRGDLPRDDVPLNRTPAFGVNPVGGELIWLMDSAAASQLPAGIKFKAKNV